MAVTPHLIDEALQSDSKCLGIRVDGKPCRSTIVGDYGYCFSHDPTREEDRTVARTREGRASSKLRRARKLAPPMLIDVYEELQSALTDVRSGVLSPAQGQSMSSLARALVTTLQVGELEERLRNLERRIE